MTEMHKGLPVIDEMDVTVEGTVPVNPLAVQPTVDALIAKYNGIIGGLTGQLAQLQAVHEAYVLNAQQVVQTLTQRNHELEKQAGVTEAEKIVTNGTPG